jgi:hypothetical protein
MLTMIAVSMTGAGLLKFLVAAAASLALVAGTLAIEKTGIIGDSHKRTYVANAAAMTKGLAVVRVTDDNHVALAGANAVATGIIDEANISAGEPIAIIEASEAVAKIGAAVTVDAFLKTDASARLVPATTAADNIVAQAVSSGANANDFIVVRIVRFIHP